MTTYNTLDLNPNHCCDSALLCSLTALKDRTSSQLVCPRQRGLDQSESYLDIKAYMASNKKQEPPNKVKTNTHSPYKDRSTGVTQLWPFASLQQTASLSIKILKPLGALLLCIFLVWQLIFTPAYSAIAVIDSRLLAESMRQRSLAVKQWAKDYDQQIKHLNQMVTTYNLMDKNYAMPHQNTWQDITHMQEQSLALLYATKSLWNEYGASQRYYAENLKAQAWEKCIATRSCDFGQALQQINTLQYEQAQQAYENAEQMSKQIEDQINTIQSISLEGLNSQSLAATIDTMSKITGSVALSMADLNQQISILTRIASQNLTKQSQTEEINKAFIEVITDFDPVYVAPINSELRY